MFKGELILTAQLGGYETGRYEVLGNNKNKVLEKLKALSRQVECLHSVYTNHDYIITKIN